jgi:prepilin-type N-terminal cleavage/methylation domain-containing protein
MKTDDSGMTLVEVLVALVVLSIGVLALTGSSAMINRMIGRGRVETHAALLAAGQMEKLRQAAASTVPRCASPGWTVAPSGKVRRVRVTVSYLTIRGRRSAVLETGVEC